MARNGVAVVALKAGAVVDAVALEGEAVAVAEVAVAVAVVETTFDLGLRIAVVANGPAGVVA